MVILSAICILSLLGNVLAIPSISRAMQVHESRASAPSGFSLAGAPSAGTMINLRINLAQNDIDGLVDKLYDVSTPSSNNYGKYLSKEEVEQFVAPSPDTTSAVTQWLEANNITWTTLSPAGDWLGISVSVEEANRLLDADYGIYTHIATGKKLTRTLSYSIPTQLTEHVEFIHPTINFAVLDSRGPIKVSISPSNLTSDTAPSSCATSITPTCLQEEYGIPSTPGPDSESGIAVSGFIDQWASQSDLEEFLSTFRRDISSSTTFTLQTLDGGQNPQSSGEAGIEADLDIQYTIGLATGIPVTFISVGEDNNDGVAGFLDLANSLLSQSKPPQVLTTSYGFNEDDFQDQPSLATNLCNAYAQLGARGVTVLFSSGDGGVGGSQSTGCDTFLPTFPSTCPFVTSVGATQGVGAEVAASFSSGGFSNIFAIPSYQSTAVSGYLSSIGDTNEGLFNRSGRAFPDVAFNGVDFNIIYNGEQSLVDGTSCSSPSFAALVSLINSELIASSLPTLGFLNPLIYSTGASAFTDITSGNNPGCGTDGFSAAKGWDPITGFGTPVYSELLAAAKSKTTSS